MKNRYVLMIIFVSLFFSGCAKYPKLHEAMSLNDSPLNDATGRIVFMKSNNVGEYGIDGQELTTNLLFGNSHDQVMTYKIFEIIDGEFRPIEDFLYWRDNFPSFYIDVPTGKHRFVIARTRTDFFITHLIGKMVVLDISVQAEKTVVVQFNKVIS